MNGSIPVILGLATWYISQKGSKLYKDSQELKLTPINLKASSLNDINLVFQIINPTGSSYVIKNLSANLYYKNEVFGSIDRRDPFEIKKNDTAQIQFKVKIRPGEDVATLIKLFFNKKETKKIRILGAFTYLGFSIPIDKEIVLNA